MKVSIALLLASLGWALFRLAWPSLAVAAEPPAAAEAFARLKSLEGTWEGIGGIAGQEQGPTTVIYDVTAAGHAVVETFFPGTPEEMVTVYHLDAGDLVGTHYCAIGNQPRFRYQPTGKADEIYLTFDGRGATIDPARDTFIHDVRFTFDGPDRLHAEMTHFVAGKDGGKVELRLTRGGTV